jgi:hypothetical protein
MPNCSCNESTTSSDETSDDERYCNRHKVTKNRQNCSRCSKDICKRCSKPKKTENKLSRDVCKKKENEPKEEIKDDANKKHNGCIFITIR